MAGGWLSGRVAGGWLGGFWLVAAGWLAGGGWWLIGWLPGWLTCPGGPGSLYTQLFATIRNYTRLYATIINYSPLLKSERNKITPHKLVPNLLVK